ncbi:hypothetical protein FBZ94_10238 [Bradyrhizobium sacchari]|uniref:Phage integrase family protein n=2 Tax=Bradyrhizobium sacchari TaxID=1399419 RepID=A0A560IZQ3_9BRAD|nr:hypothetical protein FBZ94_10238 [Bradyrhizobium sacchari]TWB80821.1 hypothetical protein FBZ95_10238 [Bradyrhizobium sacchari]
MLHLAFAAGMRVSELVGLWHICVPWSGRTLIKALWHDGVGLSLYAKRLDRGRYLASDVGLRGSDQGQDHK